MDEKMREYINKNLKSMDNCWFYNSMLTMTVFLLTKYMNIHILFSFFHYMHIYIFNHKAWKNGYSRLACQDTQHDRYRNCIRDHNRQHFVRSRHINSQQGTHCNHFACIKAGGCCRKSTLRDHAQKSAPYRTKFSGCADTFPCKAPRLMF